MIHQLEGVVLCLPGFSLLLSAPLEVSGLIIDDLVSALLLRIPPSPLSKFYHLCYFISSLHNNKWAGVTIFFQINIDLWYTESDVTIFFLSPLQLLLARLIDLLSTFRLMPDSALTTTKEKRLTGRQWFESGRAVAAAVVISFPTNNPLLVFVIFLYSG